MISIVLRLMLILVSVWLLFHVLRCVRKAKVQIDDMIFLSLIHISEPTRPY